MSKFLTNLVTDIDEINSIYRLRSRPYLEQTVTGKNIDIAKQKADIETQDSWEIVPSKFKKSVKLRKSKASDVGLEDEIWSLLVRMGFDEYSKDRNFKVFIDEKTPPRQIDVFAKDSQTALLVECTTSEGGKEKNLNDLIEKILSIKSQVFASINEHYYPSVKLNIRWIIATRNIRWRNADLTKAAVNKIVVLKDEDIDYYKKLTNIFRTAAKYQLLGHVFAEEKIHEMDIKVPATKGKMGGQAFYNFLIKPLDLLKLSYIRHKVTRTIEYAETYQRQLNPKRLKSIANYIDNGGQFPTNIVINISTKNQLGFDKKEIIGESSFGILHLPNHYASAYVIDGQHRLYGYAFSRRIKKGVEDKTTFPVLAYVNLPTKMEADLFVDINSKQEKVQTNLIKEIYADLKWESKDLNEKLEALRSRTAIALNESVNSPFYDRFALAGKDKTSFRCLTLTSFSDGLKENRLFGEMTGIFKPGYLYASYDPDFTESLEKACDILIHYFQIFRSALPEHWALGNDKGGYICTNMGTRALLIVLKDILAHIEADLKIELDDLPAKSIVQYIDEYVEPLKKFFTEATADTYKHIRDRQAKKGVSDNAIFLMSQINKHIPKFCSDKLKEYLATVDEEGTAEAQKLIDEIEYFMFERVTEKLREKFGDNWWYEGVPEKVRLQCSETHQKEKGVKKPEQYIHIIDLQSIASANWDLFENYFTISKDGGKEKKLKWLVDLNSIRNITHHRPKWPAKKEEVNFVKEIYKVVMTKFL